MRKTVIYIVTLLLCTAVLSSCGGNTPVCGMLEYNQNEISDINSYMKSASLFLPSAMDCKVTFGSVPSLLLSLNAERVSFLMLPSETSEYVIKSSPELLYIASPAGYTLKMGFRKEDMQLRDEVNGAIAALDTDRTLSLLCEEWVYGFSEEKVTFEKAKSEEAETLVVGVTGDFAPMDYVSADGQPAGFNVALISEIGKYLGKNLEIVVIETSARFSALESGRIDIIFCVASVPDEYFTSDESSYLLSDSYMYGLYSFLTKSFPPETIKELYQIQ